MTIRPIRRVFTRGDWPEARRVAALLRQETVGGALLLFAALAALVWANSPWRDSYHDLVAAMIGPDVLHLQLSLAHWTSDGLLAIFFFLAGLELKHEFTHGALRDPGKAAVPIVAACCGVAIPAILYAACQALGAGALEGWAIPTATDIAFALAVLAVIGTHLPSALRSFLLTLAVVDDLIAITIIALFYTSSISPVWLAVALVALAGFGLTMRGNRNPLLLLTLGLIAWLAVLNSGVHATVAGVALGLLVPVSPRGDERSSLGSRIDSRLRPFSAAVCVPLFAFCAAGVTVVGGGLGDALRDPVTIGVVVGLVLGKTVGVFGGTALMVRLTRAQLDDDLEWSDVFGLSLLAGVGFTVSLLIGELAFGSGSAADEHVKLGILAGSLLAAILASVVLRSRNATYRRIQQQESLDEDGDGVPDCYAEDGPQTAS
ncbi:Na(+)/H(+) antiporter NhaA [Flexivirga endophytica]|uniref:Na(+)/H(+) antiporter NhaA n=1 Tax=Flexivirga endophytica TaxID=1849103 RepID=A0A916WRS3_9MICO|nr:Na+/H+ antiporter NhaA [Flexivirga endophytica]GGB26574.1 Na(+)/H(+) antiporter NhaA [Flexivirga endophytica]GHB55063.1 Na(+)/H(+) antiporter NhaA [Flexivirga endophytica]